MREEGADAGFGLGVARENLDAAVFHGSALNDGDGGEGAGAVADGSADFENEVVGNVDKDGRGEDGEDGALKPGGGDHLRADSMEEL